MDLIVPEVESVDTVLVINPDTRIINVGSGLLLGVETDNDAERVKFQCPKIVGDNLDLTQYHIYIHYQNAKGEKGKYLCEDIEDGGENITFSWLLSQKVTLYKGQTKFLVCAKKTQEDTIIWNTALASGNVLEGLDVDEEIVQQNDDVIEQILLKLEQIEASGGTGDINNAKVTFTEAEERTNIESQETMSTMFSKIKKWFTDLKTVAFTGSYNDLLNKPDIPEAYTLPQANENQLGGIKAKAKTTEDNEVAIGSDGKLYANSVSQEQVNTAINGLLEDGSLANMTIKDNSITPVKTDFMGILKSKPIETTLSGDGYNRQKTDYIDVDGVDTIYALVEGASNNKCGFEIKYFNSEKTSLSTETFNGKEESRLLYYSLTDDGSYYLTQKFTIELTKPENTKYVIISFTNFVNGTHTAQLFYNDSYNDYNESDNYLSFKNKYNREKLIDDYSIDLSKTNFLTYNNPNLINVNKIGDTGYSTSNDGSIYYQFGSISYSNYFLDYIDTSEHKDIYFRFATNTYALANNFGRIACYDEDKTWLYCDTGTGEHVTYTGVRNASGSAIEFTYITMDDGEQVNMVWVVKLTVPEEVKYIRFGALHAIVNIYPLYKYIMVSYDDILNLTAIADRYEKVINEDFKALVNDCLENTETKTMVMIGDSLTNWGGGSDNGDGFLKIVHDKTGIITKNEGLAGATWQTGEGQTQCGVTRINTLISEERKYDLYCFLLGTNGGSATDAGETSSDTSTMVGAIRYCLETLKAYDPTAQILVCLPPQRAEENENQESVNNVIKTIAEYYSVETLDLYHGSGIVPNTKIADINYLSDGLHLNDNGKAVLGNILSAKIKYLLCI